MHNVVGTFQVEILDESNLVENSPTQRQRIEYESSALLLINQYEKKIITNLKKYGTRYVKFYYVDLAILNISLNSESYA